MSEVEVLRPTWDVQKDRKLDDQKRRLENAGLKIQE